MSQIWVHSMTCCSVLATANGVEIFSTGFTWKLRMHGCTCCWDLLLSKCHWISEYAINLRQSNWSCHLNHRSSMNEITVWSWYWRDYQHGALLTDGVSAIGRRDASGSSLARRSLPVGTTFPLILKLAHSHRYVTPWFEWQKYYWKNTEFLLLSDACQGPLDVELALTVH